MLFILCFLFIFQGQAPKRQKKGEFDSFDNMVNKYKNNIMAKKQSKWFE